jgi:pimeloyl-ACP methyl ester carboxylesterase
MGQRLAPAAVVTDSLQPLPGVERTELSTSRGVVYGTRGQGSPVILLHGWCLNRRLWLYQEEALLDRYRVLTPDLPGFGESAGLAGPYTFERYAAELQSFIAELELDRVVVVGFAFGAAVAMALAARDPARLAGLVLIGVPSATHAAYDRMPRAMRRDWPEFARRSAEAICKQPQSAATLAWLTAMFAATPLPVALATVNLLAAFDPAPLSAAIRVPSLFIHGAQDDIVPVSVAATCVGQMQQARLETVEDCGHLVILDQKERLNQLLQEYIETAGPHAA